MSISVDDSTSARFTGTVDEDVDITSGSFTPANNSLLVFCGGADNAGTAVPAPLVAGGSLTWTERVTRTSNESAGNHGLGTIWTAPVTTGASMQVTFRRTTGGGTLRMSGKIYIVTGHAASPIGVSNEGTTTTDPTNGSITATVSGDGGRLFGAWTDWNQTGVTSTDVEDVGNYAGEVTVASAYKSADHAANSGTQSINMNFGGTPACNWVVLEILAAASGSDEEAALSGSSITGGVGTTTPSGAGSVGGSALTPGHGTTGPGISIGL